MIALSDKTTDIGDSRVIEKGLCIGECSKIQRLQSTIVEAVRAI